MSDLYDFSLKAIDGTDLSLDDYRGKVLLLVNVASQCGLTPQYEGLQKLHAEYSPRGFSVLGFPCNQFGGHPHDQANLDEPLSSLGPFEIRWETFERTSGGGAADARSITAALLGADAAIIVLGMASLFPDSLPPAP